MKKLLALTVAALVFVGSSAFAEDSHKCPTGQHWDAKAKVCVATPAPKPKPY